jgi:plasmid stabilization system protein ParE
MAKGVAFTDQAKSDLRSISQPIALQILRTLARFLESDVRTQDYRVMFRDYGDRIEVTRVRHRKDAYR